MVGFKKLMTKTAGFFKGKGTFITMTLCIAAIGGAGIFAYNKTVDSLNGTLDSAISDSEDASAADKKQDGVLKDNSLSDPLQAIADAQPRVFPTSGQVINDFSDGELVYSETLGVWETHNGIDIAADEGTDVVAMTGGVVLDVWEDTLWGYCVSIDHQNTVVSYYYGLGNEIAVVAGDTVDSGDIIGVVGKTASAEIVLPSHIHFALKRNGEWIDPVQFVTPDASK